MPALTIAETTFPCKCEKLSYGTILDANTWAATVRYLLIVGPMYGSVPELTVTLQQSDDTYIWVPVPGTTPELIDLPDRSLEVDFTRTKRYLRPLYEVSGLRPAFVIAALYINNP